MGDAAPRPLKLTLDVTRHLCVAALPLGAGAPAGGEADVDARVNSVAFSDDGLVAYAASNDGVLSVIDVRSGARTAEVHVRDAGCRLVTATHHAAGVLHAAATGGAITYHNLHENRVVRVFRGHEARVTSLSMNPVTDHFLSVGLDGNFFIWDLRASAPVGKGEGRERAQRQHAHARARAH